MKPKTLHSLSRWLGLASILLAIPIWAWVVRASRLPKFILPSATDRIKAGKPVTGLALVSAFWARYCYGTTDSGKSIAPNDPSWTRLNAEARRAKDDPAAWLAMTDIFGRLAQDPTYTEAFSHALNTIWAIGTKATLEAYLMGRL